MKASRTTQPYRAGARQPSAALTAMLRGKPANGVSPVDVRNASLLVAAGKQRTGRAARQSRTAARPPRPPR